MDRSYNSVFLFLVLFMHACEYSARPIWNIHEIFPPHEIQEKLEFSGNCKKDSDNSKSKEGGILHKKNEGIGNSSGNNEDWESSLHSAMTNTTKLEGGRLPQLKKRGKSLNSSIFSDIVTDYEPPHRKSPIPN